MGLFIELSVIIVLILINGALAAAEMALVASRKVRLRQMAAEGNRKAKQALRLAEEPDRLFPTVQVGITLVGIMTGAFSGAAFSERLAALLIKIAFLAPYANILALLIVVVPVTYLSLVIGELVPKRLAVTYPEKVAMLFAPVMTALTTLFYPMVKLLSFSTSQVFKLLGLKSPHDANLTEDEIRIILGEGVKSGVLEKSEWEMLERIFRLGDRRAGALMTHRSNLEWINLNHPISDNLRIMRESNNFIFPVTAGDGDIVGTLASKDLLDEKYLAGPLDIKKLIKPPMFVPENMQALTLLNELKKQRQTMAVVVDEYGALEGVVTVRNIMKSVLGDMPSAAEDRHTGELVSRQRADGSWLLDGSMPFDETLALLELKPPSDEEVGHFETLAGFILDQLESIPVLGDSFTWHGWEFEVVDMDDKRIDRILAVPPKKDQNNEQ